MNQQLSSNKPIEICIPRVSIEITRQFIFQTFCKLKIGYIEKIIEIPLRADANFKRIIIRIKWNTNPGYSEYMQSRLKNNEPLNIVYNMPWYWKIVASHPQK